MAALAAVVDWLRLIRRKIEADGGLPSLDELWRQYLISCDQSG
jgi:hypothetical protein